jgi:hypothetical protein
MLLANKGNKFIYILFQKFNGRDQTPEKALTVSHFYRALAQSDRKTEPSRRNILADSGTNQTVQRTHVAE